LKRKWDGVGQDVRYLPPGEGRRSLWVLGELVTYKITSNQTGGAYSLFEVETPPGCRVLPHVQHREDEAFYVLEGEYEFLVDGRIIEAGAGALIHVPKGNLHAHKNVGKEPGRMLASQTPGGLHERFFEKLGAITKDTSIPRDSENPPDMQSIAKIAAEYGIEVHPTGRSYSGQEGITG
jgi:quercetin dioxygenase-like cupin family protein